VTEPDLRPLALVTGDVTFAVSLAIASMAFVSPCLISGAMPEPGRPAAKPT